MDNDDTLLNNRGPQPGAETVYGTDDNNMVMSEKVCIKSLSFRFLKIYFKLGNTDFYHSLYH